MSQDLNPDDPALTMDTDDVASMNGVSADNDTLPDAPPIVSDSGSDQQSADDCMPRPHAHLYPYRGRH